MARVRSNIGFARMGMVPAPSHFHGSDAQFPQTILTIWLNPRRRRKLFKIIPFGIMWCAFSLPYLLLEYGLLGDATEYPSTKNPYDYHNALLVTPIAAFVIGTLLGVDWCPNSRRGSIAELPPQVKLER